MNLKLQRNQAYIDDLNNNVHNLPCTIIGSKQTSFSTAVDLCLNDSNCKRVVSNIDSKNVISYSLCSNSIPSVCLDDKICCSNCTSLTSLTSSSLTSSFTSLNGAGAQFIKDGTFNTCTPVTGSTGNILLYLSATAALSAANVYNKAALLNNKPVCQSITTKLVNGKQFFVLCLNSVNACSTDCSSSCSTCNVNNNINSTSGPSGSNTGVSGYNTSTIPPPVNSTLTAVLALPQNIPDDTGNIIYKQCPPATLNPLRTLNTNRKTVSLFEDFNYGGAFAEVYEGRYTYSAAKDTGFQNRMGLGSELTDIHRYAVRSIKVNPGMQITLYSQPEYTGRTITLREDTPCLLPYNFDNIMQSFIVSVDNLYKSNESNILVPDYLVYEKTSAGYLILENSQTISIDGPVKKVVSAPKETTFLFTIETPWWGDYYFLTFYSKSIYQATDLVTIKILFTNLSDVKFEFYYGTYDTYIYQANMPIAIPANSHECAYMVRILNDTLIMSYQTNSMFRPEILKLQFDGLVPPSISAPKQLFQATVAHKLLLRTKIYSN